MQINRSLQEIITLVGGEATLDQRFFIKNLASIHTAGPEDIAIVIETGDASVFESSVLHALQSCKAALIIAAKKLDPTKHYLIVKDPLAALTTLHRSLTLPPRYQHHPNANISPTANIGADVIIGAGAVIDDHTTIGSFSNIGSQVFIGKNCSLGNHVLIHPGVKILDGTIIGDHTIINAGSVIGSDGFGYQVNTTGLTKIPHIGRVRIGSHVEIGANVCIDRALFDETVVGNGVKIDNLVHIAHNVQVGDHTAILALTGIAGSTKIGRGCQIGGMVAIKNHITIGNGVKIVSQSGVSKNVPDGQIIAGSPALPLEKWRRIVATIPRLPELVREATDIKQQLEKTKNRAWWQKLFGG